MNLRASLLLFSICLVWEGTVGVACNGYVGSHYGSQKIPGRSCADILEKRHHKCKDGIYWIELGTSKPFPVFCNMKAGGWTMAFKIIAEISGVPSKVWDLPFSTYEYSLQALNVNNDFKHHYKNRIVQNWSLFKPKEARVVLYKKTKEEVVLRFTTVNSDNKNWFSQANILESPWQDILTEEKNYFTLTGVTEGSTARDFYISRNHGGCEVDAGWLSVGNLKVCKWENRFPAGVKLIYSKEATHIIWNEFDKVGTADVFAVFLR